MNIEQLKQEILSQFGYPVVKVELDDTQWDGIVRRSRRWFQAKKGVLGCELMSINEGQTEYTIPTNAWVIRDIILPSRSDVSSLLSLGFFDVVPLNSMNLGSITSGFNSYSSYAQILMALETRKRVFGAEPDWFVIGDKIHVAGMKSGGASVSGFSGKMLVFFTKKEWDVDELRDRDEDLFYRYTMNEAKYVLGRIRGKYKDYPAAGGSVAMDADDLLSEYKDDKAILEEEISESQYPMNLIVG